MKKEIKLGNDTVEMSASALTPFLYKKMFQRDIIKDIQTLREQATKDGSLDPEITVMLDYTMTKEANKDLEPLEDWLSKYELFDIYMAFNDIVTLWGLNEQTNSVPRKK